MPRRKYVPTESERKMVEEMSAYGVAAEHIRLCTLNPETGQPLEHTCFYEVFGQEIKTATSKLVWRAGKVLLELADNPDTPADVRMKSAIRILESRGGWKSPVQLEAKIETDASGARERLMQLMQGWAERQVQHQRQAIEFGGNCVPLPPVRLVRPTGD